MPALLSGRATTFPCPTTSEKLGQPQWASNFAVDSKSTSPQTTQRYAPASLASQ